jgi:hypothetical protein
MLGAHSSLLRTSHCCQESCQNRVIFQFLISQKAWSVTSCRFFLAVVHIKEPERSSFQRIATFGAYFFLHSWAQRSLGIFNHRHQSLVLITLFMMKGSLRPKPPCSLGQQSLSHLTNIIFFPVLRPCQMKFLCRLLIVVSTNFGAASTEKEYIGRAWRTAWRRVRRLGILRAL